MNNAASHHHKILVKILLNYSYILVNIYYFSLVKEKILQRFSEVLFHNSHFSQRTCLFHPEFFYHDL